VSTVTVSNRGNKRTSKEPPGTENISLKSRADIRTGIPVHRVRGKTAALVTARLMQACRHAGGGDVGLQEGYQNRTY
jgi:hypothetical protein